MSSLPTESSPAPIVSRLPLFLRRRHYLVDPATQLRIAREFAIVLFVAVVLVLGNYHVFDTLNALYDEGTLSYSSDAWLEHLLVWGYIVGTVVASIALVILFSMFYSHRIVGPAQKLNASMERIAAGDLSVLVSLRDSDYLQDVAGGVNGISQAWQVHVSDLRIAVDLLKYQVQQGDAVEIAKGMAGVEAVLARFTVGVIPEKKEQAPQQPRSWPGTSSGLPEDDAGAETVNEPAGSPAAGEAVQADSKASTD